MNPRYWPLIATITIFVVAYALAVMQFPALFSTRVLGNLLTDNAFLGVTAVGMTFVILSGGIDLSVGSVIAFSSVLIAVLVSQLGIHPLPAFAITLCVCTLFGATMGTMIHYLEVPPFIVTLAGMFLARGLTFLLTQDSLSVDHGFYDWIRQFYWLMPGGGRLTFNGGLMLLVFAVGIVIAHRTRFGSYVYALGGNPQSAALLGVPVARTTIAIYALSSFLAGLSGIVYSLYTSSGYPLAAVGVELDTIAAVVIGGTLLSGGFGFMLGTLVGVFIQGMIQTYIVFDGTLSSWWTKIVIGALLFGFIVLQRVIVAASKRDWRKTKMTPART